MKPPRLSVWMLLGTVALGTIAGCRGREDKKSAALAASPALDSPRLADLARRAAKGGDAVIKDFWREMRGAAPIIEAIPGDDKSMLFTFVLRDDGAMRAVALRGCPTDRPSEPMSRLGKTDVWYRSLRLPKDARFTYVFWINPPEPLPTGHEEVLRYMKASPPRPDPLNPRKFMDLSVAEGPDAPPESWLEPGPGIPYGEVLPAQIQSRLLGGSRNVVTYTPPGFAPHAGDPPQLLIVLDGQVHGGQVRSPVSLPTMLDNLIAAGEIARTLAVLVNEDTYDQREHDLNASETFSAFLAEELVPWAEARWVIRADPRRTILLGESSGGLAAAYAALKYPRVFGNVISLSGYFSYAPAGDAKTRGGHPGVGWLARQYEAAENAPVRFYLEVGRFEHERGENHLLSPLSANRQFRDVLAA